MTPISSWGRLSADAHEVVRLTDRDRAARQIAESARPGLAYGMGRSYGDVCLNPGGTLWQTTALDRFIDFDPVQGTLTCEAGVLLRDIQHLLIPRGWSLPVTPGTQLATVGGAIANDVHGKNHHAVGTFGDHLEHLTLIRSDGEIIECGPHLRSDWFRATVGGLGLTGVVIDTRIRLRRVPGPWLATETIPYSDLDAFFRHADEAESGWEHTVSWIDCLAGGARGIFMRANPCATQQTSSSPGRKRRMPFVPPISLVNGLTLRPFNLAYFYRQRQRAGHAITHYEPFFYPLDNVLDWNRMYGPRGFFQYQSVVPRIAGLDATRAMLAQIARLGEGSFLAVLKTFGERPAPGMLSFARPGVTLALDFPNRGARTLRLFERLDAIVREAGGCLYPAKDARMPRDLFPASGSTLNEFLRYRDPGISSALSRRLIGD